MTPKKILIVAGEPSGDLYASNLVTDLKHISSSLTFFGIGGSLSKKAGVRIVFDIKDLAIVGIVEVLKKIFTVGAAYSRILRAVDAERPDCAVLIDYPGFNLRLAGALKKRGIPVIYYVSPQVWAWGEGRIETIRRTVDKIIVFFKFEDSIYKAHRVNSEWVGHPLLDIVAPTLERTEIARKYSLAQDRPTIALLPGSRTMEVKSLLPVMLKAMKLMHAEIPRLQLIIAKYRDIPLSLYREYTEDAGIDVIYAEDETYNILSFSDAAIVASGTATLETVIIGTPLVITYRMNPLTYFIIKRVAKTRYAGLPNIIAGKEIVPELIQDDATPEKIAEKIREILLNNKTRATMFGDLKWVRNTLGTPGARMRAAQAVWDFLLKKSGDSPER